MRRLLSVFIGVHPWLSFGCGYAALRISWFLINAIRRTPPYTPGWGPLFEAALAVRRRFLPGRLFDLRGRTRPGFIQLGRLLPERVKGLPPPTFSRPIGRSDFLFRHLEAQVPQLLRNRLPTKRRTRPRPPGAVDLLDERLVAPATDHRLACGPDSGHADCLTPSQKFHNKRVAKVFNSVHAHPMGKGGIRRRKGNRRKRCVFIRAWVSESVSAPVPQTVRVLNLDRSKFVRRLLIGNSAQETASDNPHRAQTSDVNGSPTLLRPSATVITNCRRIT